MAKLDEKIYLKKSKSTTFQKWEVVDADNLGIYVEGIKNGRYQLFEIKELTELDISLNITEK